MVLSGAGNRGYALRRGDLGNGGIEAQNCGYVYIRTYG